MLRDNRKYVFVSAADVDEVLAPLLTCALKPLDFDAITSRRWVKSTTPPIRPVFALQMTKGGELVPRWGFSLDYVPHVSGRSVSWHRTPKTALFDLCIDAIDSPSPDESRILCLSRSDVMQHGVEEVISHAVDRAKALWRQVNSEADLPAVFDYVRSETRGFDNHAQHPFAYAFTLARLGRLDDATVEFDAFVRRGFYADSVARKLRELFQMASETSVRAGAK